MYFNNDYKTPKDRISDELRKKLLNEEYNYSETINIFSDKNLKDSMSNASLAMIYAKTQTFDDLYDDSEALSKGTLFSSLYFPFEAYCCGRKMPLTKGGFGK